MLVIAVKAKGQLGYPLQDTILSTIASAPAPVGMGEDVSDLTECRREANKMDSFRAGSSYTPGTPGRCYIVYRSPFNQPSAMFHAPGFTFFARQFNYPCVHGAAYYKLGHIHRLLCLCSEDDVYNLNGLRPVYRGRYCDMGKYSVLQGDSYSHYFSPDLYGMVSSAVTFLPDLQGKRPILITALHAMQTRSSDENSVRLSVCPSVCPSHACIVTKR